MSAGEQPVNGEDEEGKGHWCPLDGRDGPLPALDGTAEKAKVIPCPGKVM